MPDLVQSGTLNSGKYTKNMWQLNLPSYQYNVKKSGENWLIFDFLRKKFVRLTPEEWVRQHFLHYIIDEMHFPGTMIAVEQQIVINGQSKRCDAILYNSNMQAIAVFEFKAPTVTLNQSTLDQVSVYNTALQINHIFISNGINHHYLQLSFDRKSYIILEKIPTFEEFLAFSAIL
jgi:hypothetical protein